MTRCSLLAVCLWIILIFSTPQLWAAEVPFSAGEVIHYNIKQMGLKVGTASLLFAGERKLGGRPLFLIVFTSRGIRFYDEERIYVDPKTFRPVRVIRDLDIFGKKEKITEAYASDGKVHIRKISGGKMRAWRLAKQGALDNIYGFIYRYRSLGDIPADKKFQLSLPTMNVVMQFGGYQNFNASGRTYRSILIKSVPAKYSIWMDTGARRLPLRIAGAVGMANTVMTMVDYEEK